jgi:hypothetical protein
MSPVAAKKPSQFDPKIFLSIINGGRKIAAFPKKQTILLRAIRPMLFSIYRKEK